MLGMVSGRGVEMAARNNNQEEKEADKSGCKARMLTREGCAVHTLGPLAMSSAAYALF
jgi:hypothetical protein